MWDAYFDGLKEDIKSRRDRGKDLSIMSMPSLDKDIWGIQKKKLTIIGARPSQGKSALLRAMTLDFIRQRKNTMVFSWEETKDGFVENLLSLYGLVNNFDIVTGNFGTEKHTEAINGLKNILIKNNLHIIERRGRTVGDFERLVRQAKNLDCVMVDYLQLIDTSGYNSEKQAYDEFLKTARSLSQELGFSIVVASQINRATIQNKQVTPPMMNELKGSGVLEEHADLIFLLHWDYFYNRNDISTKNDYKIIVAKNKQTGRTFIKDCFFYPEYFKISETPLEGEHKEYSPHEKEDNPLGC